MEIMARRKGELSKGAVDRDYPHQVELRADLTTGKNYDIALAFCRNLTLAPRGHSRRKENTDYNVWCFADPESRGCFSGAVRRRTDDGKGKEEMNRIQPPLALNQPPRIPRSTWIFHHED